MSPDGIIVCLRNCTLYMASTLLHSFCKRRKRKWNRPFTRLYPQYAKNGLGMRLRPPSPMKTYLPQVLHRVSVLGVRLCIIYLTKVKTAKMHNTRGSYAVMPIIHAFNSPFLTSCTRRALSSLKSQACSHVRKHFSVEGGDRSNHFYRRCY